MRASSLLCSLLALTLSSFVVAGTLPSPQVLEQDDVPHTYTFDELKPKAYQQDGSFRQPYFRFLILFKKKPGVTDEFMHRHWKTVHADITMSTRNVGVQIQRYNQFHQDQEYKDRIKPLIDTGKMEIVPYDGIAEFHAEDYKSFETFMLGVFNNTVILDDENNFVDHSVPLQVMAGYDNLIFGSGIKTSNGYHGILPGDHRLRNVD